MSDGAPTVSVVICTYTPDRWPDLLDAVASVERQSVRPLETIVVVDHADLLLARVRRALPHVAALANAERQGLSGARNTGVLAARGDVVAFLDDDAVAEDDWLELLAGPYDRASVLGVGGSVEPTWPGASRPDWFPAEFDWVVGCSYHGQPETSVPVRNPIGANMSFRREAFARAGTFRSEMGRVGKRPAGCEETELAIRMQRAIPGSVVLLEPRARVRHRVTTERTKWRYFASRCFAEGGSKAAVARHAGSRDGLSSERHHVLITLPRGAAGAVAEAWRARRPRIALRALAIPAGLAMTTAGYVGGRARRA
jgi:glycosyltransferase involved in cell wall biosynthesis